MEHVTRSPSSGAARSSTASSRLLRGGEQYGFELVRKLSEVDGLVTSEGTIYPLLTRLRRDKLVTTFWRESEGGTTEALLPAHRRGPRGSRRLQSRVGPIPRWRRRLARRGGNRMTTHASQLVADYLRRLERASASLPRTRRTELVAEIREHIDDALLEAGAADEVAVRNVLERLGPPEEIAAAAAPPVGSDRARRQARGRGADRAGGALHRLALGIPLVLLSRAWSGRDKASACCSPQCRSSREFSWSGRRNRASGEWFTGRNPRRCDDVSGGRNRWTTGWDRWRCGSGQRTSSAGSSAAAYLALRLRRTAQPRALEV